VNFAEKQRRKQRFNPQSLLFDAENYSKKRDSLTKKQYLCDEYAAA